MGHRVGLEMPDPEQDQPNGAQITPAARTSLARTSLTRTSSKQGRGDRVDRRSQSKGERRGEARSGLHKPDRLSALISRFHVQARVISFVPKTMSLDEVVDAGKDETLGEKSQPGKNSQNQNLIDQTLNDGSLQDTAANFFIARFAQLEKPVRSQLLLSEEGGRDFVADEPLLVFFPRGVAGPSGVKKTGPKIKSEVEPHVGKGDANSADVSVSGGYICAVVDTGGVANPIALALPDLVVVRLRHSQPLQAVTNILLEEAQAPRCGGQAVIDRLCEIVVIRLLRHLIEAGDAQVGLLAGLAHPNLSLAIVAIHDNPGRAFTLEDLSVISAMSRTHFANSFRKVVGVTPGQYLSNWRLTLARIEIAKGTPLKTIARRIGFSSPAALSRAFSRHFGVSPRAEMGHKIL